jgi:Tfp pilus assembly protein PilF
VEPSAHQRARVANELAPTDVEIVNNFGYAYLRHHDPEAAEAWLLLALVLAPERVNAWVNLGQAYAKQGQHSMAVLFGQWLSLFQKSSRDPPV